MVVEASLRTVCNVLNGVPRSQHEDLRPGNRYRENHLETSAKLDFFARPELISKTSRD
jgi:hypothetical protein